jgi:peroxiredoxin Q/BCP
MSIKVGKKLPNFKILADNGKIINSKDFLDKNVIIYFYPKDNTPGCTNQACAFKDKKNQFSKKNTIIIGISKDSIDKHEKFKKKYNLNFILGSDEDTKICEKFDVWKEKSMYGKKYMGIERSTFLIDSKGVVRKEWRKVKVTNHIEDVLSAVNKL